MKEFIIETIKLVRRYRIGIHTLAKALIARQSLTYDEVLTVMQPYVSRDMQDIAAANVLRTASTAGAEPVVASVTARIAYT